MLNRLRTQKGFTLIELMIVVAIIGILAAIAIPNFIAYRNKSFCSRVEADADGIAAALSDYFAIPTHVALPVLGTAAGNLTYRFSGEGATRNTGTITANDPNVRITITVTDGSGRCPSDYRTAAAYWAPDGAATVGVFTKYISVQ